MDKDTGKADHNKGPSFLTLNPYIPKQLGRRKARKMAMPKPSVASGQSIFDVV